MIGKEATFFLYDHLGNTRVAFQSNGTLATVFNAIDYYPYGKVLREFDQGTINGDRYLTTAHERDGETGLDYRGARRYDSEVARFLSTDPWANKYPQWSTYCYVMGNPVMLIDPSGKGPEDGEPSKREVKKMSNYVDHMVSIAQKLSAKEKRQAESYAKKHDGVVRERKDENGFKRYSVYNKNINDDTGDEVIIYPRKDFNEKSWSKLAKQSDKATNFLFSSTNSSVSGGYGSGMWGITSGVSFFGDNGYNHTQFVSTFYLSAGPDKGWHKMVTTGTEMYGVNYEISYGLIYGGYTGNTSEMTVSTLSGEGCQIGGDILAGDNFWWSYNNYGSISWVGSTITVGAAIGFQTGKTFTEIKY